MKQLKPLWFKGYVTIKVMGHYPERFFDLCARRNIPVWSIRKQSELECLADVYVDDIHKLRKIRRQTHYKLSFVRKKGMLFFIKRLKNYHQLLISLFIACLVFLYLTQSILFIQIEGVPTEMEKQLLTSLNNYGIKKGKLKLLMDKPDQIQSKILFDYPNILWVGITPNGVNYQLEVITKKQPEVKERQQRTHIYAKKDGVISEMFVAKGRPLVEVNDFVKKGQLLVTGQLNHLNQNDEDDNTENQDEQLIEVDAEIYATTWYETKLEVALEGNYQIETGEFKNKYYLQFGSFKMPIWGFGSTNFQQEKIEIDQHTLTVFDWTIPIAFLSQTHKEVEIINQERSVEQAVEIGLQQARQNLLRNLDQTSSIINEKILHQSSENGKVNLHVYFTVKENIVNTIETIQGD